MDLKADPKLTHISATCAHCKQQGIPVNQMIAAAERSADDDLAERPLKLIHRSCQFFHEREAREAGQRYAYHELRELARSLLRFVAGPEGLAAAELEHQEQVERERSRLRALRRRTEEQARRVRSRSARKRRRAAPADSEPDPPKAAA